MTTDEAFAAIKDHPDLPSPQGVALEIMRLARSGNCRLSDLARIVETDPAIASRLIKMVNSSAFPHNRQVVSLTEAIAYLGTRMVETIALGFSLVTTKGKCQSFDYVEFWSQSLARAVAGCRVAHDIGGYVPDEVFTVALLSQLGRLVLATTCPERYSTLISSITCGRHELVELERELFEIDHNELTARMMEDWGLPALVCDGVRLQYEADLARLDFSADPQRLAGVLALANRVSEQLVSKARDERPPAEMEVIASRLNLTPAAIVDLIQHVIPQWREMVTIFSLDELDDSRIKELYAEAGDLHKGIAMRESA